LGEREWWWDTGATTKKGNVPDPMSYMWRPKKKQGSSEKKEGWEGTLHGEKNGKGGGNMDGWWALDDSPGKKVDHRTNYFCVRRNAFLKPKGVRGREGKRKSYRLPRKEDRKRKDGVFRCRQKKTKETGGKEFGK